jgi:phosphomannomutase/phosphoglucomutase
MIRIFSLLAVASVIMALIAGSGAYWMSLSDANQAKQEAAEAMAQGLALSVSAQLDTLQEVVSKMAATPEVIGAIETKDSRQMAATASILEQFLPNVMKIRILPANVTDLDQSSIPHMGNADLLMAQETLKSVQAPVIQGQAENRHLAITASIVKNNEAIGVILASLKYDFLQSILNTAFLKASQATDNVIELKQQNVSLAKTGRSSAETDLSNKIQVARTLWNIHYSPAKTAGLFSDFLISSIIFIPILIIGVAFFVAYRNLTNLLRQDQGTVLKAIKDLISGKTEGSYPIKLDEMKSLVSAMVQFKRIADTSGNSSDKDSSENLIKNAEIDDFFDESDGISFLDMDLAGDTDKSTIQTPSTPISLPEMAVEQPDTPDTPDDAPSEKPVSTIFRDYDIRGVADKTITEEIVFNIGQAVASEAKEKHISTIVLGRDGRLSSPALAESMAKGIISTGLNVLDVGLVPSPLVYFVAQHTEGKSAVVVTASHNPAEYNGLKIIIDGETLAGERIQQIKQRIDEKNYLTGTPGTIDKNDMFINEYIGIIAEDIHLERPMKVVVDCGNGAAGELAPALLKTLGCEVFELFCDIDGTFPNHHPDPTNPDNLQNLIAGVEHYEADLGIAFDGDGDRLGVIDAKGKIIWADRLLMLFAQKVLADKLGGEIIYDVKCSRHLHDHIAKYGGRPTMWKTGHSHMKAKIKETGAVLAGEMSGHIFFNDRWFGFDDALYSAARLIGILSADARSSDKVFADLPESESTPEINIELNEGENIILMEQLLEKANFEDAEIITIDGMRVNFTDGWGLVRASNTMPALALRFEADNKEALARIQYQFKELLTQLKPDLTLPF